MQGDLLQSEAEAYVNTVNCMGVMGKGIALQFKEAYPDNYKLYRRACEREELRPGRMLVYDAGFLFNQRPRYIINFPTKDHWRGKSKIEWIETGLDALVREVEARSIASLALPALGCQNGGLDWSDVQPRIQSAFAPLSAIHVLLYPPQSGTTAPR
jgi:O-acetyl-ADP-ribose deacetylase (regulator of RNase III)